jgi:head-tail adaptor
VQDTEVYQRARDKARRTITIRLRWQEQRITAALRHRPPTAAELARLAALRSELRIRTPADRPACTARPKAGNGS